MSALRAANESALGLAKSALNGLRCKPAKAMAIRSLSTTAYGGGRLPAHADILRAQKLSGRQDTVALAARRAFSATTAAQHGHLDPPKAGEELYITFIDKEGDEHKIAVNKGDNLLTIAQAHDIEMEGACEGSCACSTCHVVVENEEMYDKIPEATDDENDMLDLAFGLTETSRLGCQIAMTPELNGLRVKLPNATRNMQASNFK